MVHKCKTKQSFACFCCEENELLIKNLENLRKSKLCEHALHKTMRWKQFCFCHNYVCLLRVPSFYGRYTCIKPLRILHSSNDLPSNSNHEQIMSEFLKPVQLIHLT